MTTRRANFIRYLTGKDWSARATDRRPVIGVLEGTGIGPEVIGSALRVLAAVEEVTGQGFEIRHGGLIGEAAWDASREWLPEDVVSFCAEIFDADGAILSGPGGGRYVYELRRRFDLFCKFVPVQPWPELAAAGRLAPRHLVGVDVLIVRDNSGGVYQGEWQTRDTREGRVAQHSFSYKEADVQRVLQTAARAASDRRGRVHVVVKEGGVPSISALWRELAGIEARKHGVVLEVMNIDLAAYEIIQNPTRFDVLVAPNLFGDILADVAGVLVSSRGVTFSGNFDARGNGVYQTNHGCATDLADRDVANPCGQILSLAMLLRESFGLEDAADLIEDSLAEAWRSGTRTADIAEPDSSIVGTRAMTDRVVEQVLRRCPMRSV